MTVAGGTPTLTLNDGGTATYTGGSGTNALTFSYTVGAGQNTADLAVTAVNLGTATVKDGAGNAANLTGAVTNPTGILQIDTLAPAAPTLALGTGVANGATAAEATAAGGVVTVTGEAGDSISVTFTNGTHVVTKTLTGTGSAQAVTLTAGDLTTLTNGTIGVSAKQTDAAGNVQTAAAATTSFVLDTVAPAAPALALGTGVANGVTAAEATAAGGVVTVTGEAGDSISVTFTNGTHVVTKTLTGTGSAQAVTLTAGDLTTLTNGTIGVSAKQTDAAGNVQTAAAATTSFVLDTVAPAVTAVTDNVAAAVTKGSISFTAAFSEAVTGVSASSFTATNGTVASVTAVDSSHYTVVVNPTAGVTSGNVALSLVAGGATDMAGNAAVAASLSSLDSQGIDTLAPSVMQVIASPGSGIEFPGNTVALTLNLTEAVAVTGTPTLTLNDGGTATYVSGTGTNALTFSYTVGATDSTVAALAITQANLPNGATITDGAGNAANLSGALITFPNLAIDPPSPGPTPTSIVESPSTGDLNAGTVTLTLNMSAAVTVNLSGGTPTLTLNDGGTATYVSGSGSSALIFSYTVGAGQNAASLAATAINLNGATMQDSGGNAANLLLNWPNPDRPADRHHGAGDQRDRGDALERLPQRRQDRHLYDHDERSGDGQHDRRKPDADAQ